MLNNRHKEKKTHPTACRFGKSPYLCIVFFIVLDLRFTKVGARLAPFFMPIRFVLHFFTLSLHFNINKHHL